MNNIVAINGSPKAKDSASALFISRIEDFLGMKITAYQAMKLIRQEDVSVALSDILKADTLLIVFPLYVDSLPAPLIKTLTLIEQEAANTSGSLPRVYAVCNCGFYEDKHNRLALNIIENFSVRSGMSWGGGVGIGGGEFVRMQARGLCRGSVANVFAALRELAESIQSGSAWKRNVFVTPKVPRFLHKLGGNMRWLYLAWKHGKAHSIKARPHRP